MKRPCAKCAERRAAMVAAAKKAVHKATAYVAATKGRKGPWFQTRK